MESVSRTEAMEAYWQAIEIVTKADQVIKEYENWLAKEEPEFRKRVTPGILSDGNLLEPGELYTIQCKWLNDDEIQSEDVQGLIGKRIPVNDFYIEFFGEQYNRNLSKRFWLKDDDAQIIRMFRRYAVMRGKHNKSIQTLLTYTMDASDSALAAKILPLVEYDNEERPESFVFTTFATDETIELANAFEMWCNIYNPELLVRGGNGNNAQEHTPPAVQLGGKSDRVKFPVDPIDQSRLEKLFEYLKSKGYITVETRLDDWLQANGHERQGEEFRKMRWKGQTKELAVLAATMYPENEKDKDQLKAKYGTFKWVEKWFYVEDKNMKPKIVKTTSMTEALRDYNKGYNLLETFINEIREILRGTQKQEE